MPRRYLKYLLKVSLVFFLFIAFLPFKLESKNPEDFAFLNIKSAFKKESTLEFIIPIGVGNKRIPYNKILFDKNYCSLSNSNERVVCKGLWSEVKVPYNLEYQTITFVKRPDSSDIEITDGNSFLNDNLFAENFQYHNYYLNQTMFVYKPCIFLISDLIFDSTFDIHNYKKVSLFNRKIHDQKISEQGPNVRAVTIMLKIIKIILSIIFDLIYPIFIVSLLILCTRFFGYTILKKINFNEKNFTLEVLTGASSIILLINSMLYFVEVKYIFMVLLFMAIIFLAYNYISKTSFLYFFEIRDIYLFVLISAGFLCFFTPYLIYKDAAIGMLQTDTAFYVSAAESLKHGSYYNLGKYVGFYHRSIDIAVIAFVSFVFNISTAKALFFISGFFKLMIGYVFFDFAKLTGLRNINLYLFCLVGLFLPSLNGMFQEGYFSQFIYTVFLLFFIYLMTRVVFTKIFTKEVNVKTIIPLALTGSVALLCYPFFALLILIIFVLSGLFTKLFFIRKDITKFIFTFIILIIIFSNFGLFSLFSFGKINTEVLNTIAKYIVFPFYNTPKFFTILAGIIPFHSNFELSKASSFFVYFNYLDIYNNFYKFFTLIFTLITFFILIRLYLKQFFFDLKNKFYKPINFVILFLILYTLISVIVGYIFLARGEIYAYSKFLWSSFSVLPFFLCACCAYLANYKNLTKFNFFDKVTCNIFIPCIFLFIIFAGYFSNSYIFIRFNHPSFYNLKYSDSISSFSSQVEKLNTKTNRHYIFSSSDFLDRKENEGPYVVLSFMYSILGSKGYICDNCTFRNGVEFWDFKNIEMSSVKRNIIGTLSYDSQSHIYVISNSD